MSTSGLLDQQAARCVFGSVFLFRSGAARIRWAFCWRFLSRQAPAKRSLPTVFSSPLGKACEPALLSLAASICQLTARPRWGFCRGSLDLSRWPRAGAQFPPARALRLSSEIVQTHVLRLNKISLARGQRRIFSPGRPIRRPLGAPPRRTRWVFCRGFLGLS